MCSRFYWPNGVYPHPNDCSMFISCSNNITAELDCPNGTVFNPIKRQCDNPLNVPMCLPQGIGKSEFHWFYENIKHIRDRSNIGLHHFWRFLTPSPPILHLTYTRPTPPPCKLTLKLYSLYTCIYIRYRKKTKKNKKQI